METRKKICFIVSEPVTAQAFLKDHILALAREFDVYLVANLSGGKQIRISGLKTVHHVKIERGINIAADIKSVRKLISYFKKEKFDAVHSVTPKAGLVTALAAKLAGLENRIHIFTGQVWATKTGAMRILLKSMDKLISACDNHILVDGESQRKFLISEGVISAKQSKVLGAGSICGADIERFTPAQTERDSQRKALGISDNKVVYSFMGRLNRDKGIYELLEAFNDMLPEAPDAYLILFGSDEENCQSHFNEYPNIIPGVNFTYFGPTSTPQLSLQVSDVFCLPSYREGFGLSVIEASCLGLPVICSDAYGLADTMVDNETGLRSKVKDSKTLKQAMNYFYNNPDDRKRMGEAGRSRVLNLFSGECIVKEWVEFYKKLLKAQ